MIFMSLPVSALLSPPPWQVSLGSPSYENVDKYNDDDDGDDDGDDDDDDDDDEDDDDADDDDDESYRKIGDDEKELGSWRDQYWNLILKYFKYRGKIQL